MMGEEKWVMKDMIDLHVHSNASDGTFSPREIVEYAVEKGLRAVALTDHDTTDGIEEAVAAAEGTSLEVIPGIEISTTWWGKDVHIVGLGIDWKNARFQEELLRFQQSRDSRNLMMMERLREHGMDVTYEKMMEEFPKSVWTRAHFARFLLERGYVSSIKEAFDRFLGDHASCYVPREKVTPFQGIQLIHEGGGKAVFAHPVLCRLSDGNLEKMTAEMKKAGLDGLEAYYPTYRPAEEGAMIRLAKRLSLRLSGGSDFHGANKPNIDLGCGWGNLKIPYSVWERLKEK